MKTNNNKLSFNRMYYAGIILFCIGFVFAIIETLYFGSNWFPESKAELACDVISAMVCGGGIALFYYALLNRLK